MAHIWMSHMLTHTYTHTYVWQGVMSPPKRRLHLFQFIFLFLNSDYPPFQSLLPLWWCVTSPCDASHVKRHKTKGLSCLHYYPCDSVSHLRLSACHTLFDTSQKKRDKDTCQTAVQPDRVGLSLSLVLSLCPLSFSCVLVLFVVLWSNLLDRVVSSVLSLSPVSLCLLSCLFRDKTKDCLFLLCLFLVSLSYVYVLWLCPMTWPLVTLRLQRQHHKYENNL